MREENGLPRILTALFTLAAFVVFSTGCVTRTTADMKLMPRPPAAGTEVLSVVKAGGERIEFSRSQPGQVRESTIEGRR